MRELMRSSCLVFRTFWLFMQTSTLFYVSLSWLNCFFRVIFLRINSKVWALLVLDLKTSPSCSSWFYSEKSFSLWKPVIVYWVDKLGTIWACLKSFEADFFLRETDLASGLLIYLTFKVTFLWPSLFLFLSL